MGDYQLKSIAVVLKALSDETRLRMVNLLHEKDELCVCDFVNVLKITQTKASRHLSYLKNAGIVSDRRQSQWVFYSILKKKNNTAFMELLITECLRKEKQYTSDLLKLENWLMSDTRKNI